MEMKEYYRKEGILHICGLQMRMEMKKAIV
jgi:hypothetical protein